MENVYHLDSTYMLERGKRGVVKCGDGINFRCPCDKRLVYLQVPPHEIEFSQEGLLTVHNSIGSHEDLHRQRPQNWCHFYVEDGFPRMATDAQCPGAKT